MSKQAKRVSVTRTLRIDEDIDSTLQFEADRARARFIADTPEEMNNRIRYELMPLIKEYLMEGLLVPAKEEFSKYFYDRVGEVMFE